jgi:hypothetical protein
MASNIHKSFRLRGVFLRRIVLSPIELRCPICCTTTSFQDFRMGLSSSRLSLLVVFSSLASTLLAGCGAGFQAAPGAQALSVSGTVHGGNLPISGSHIYLYAAGTGAYGGPGISANSANASVSLLTTKNATLHDGNGQYYVLADSTGAFRFTTDNTTCTTGQQLYVLAVGGNAIGGDPTKTGGLNGNNTAIGMMSVLGECSSIGSLGRVVVNEMSTVAAAYALAGFASDETHISDDEGASGNATAAAAKTGMANAFGSTANLVDLSTGAVRSTTLGGNGAVPMALLNTIANTLALCVQSSSSASSACTALFGFNGMASTVTTATAAIGMAHSPQGTSSTYTVGTLFTEIAAATDFVPNLAAAPNDFSVAIAYTGDKITAPGQISIDGDGSVYFGSGGNYIVKLLGTNAAYTATNIAGVDNPLGIAISATGVPWVAAPNYYFQLQGGALFPTDNLGTLTSLAWDKNGYLWVAGQNFAIATVPTGGFSLYTFTYAGSTGGWGNLSIDANNNAWISNKTDNIVDVLKTGLANNSGPTITSLAVPQFAPFATAVTTDGTVWVGNLTHRPGSTTQAYIEDVYLDSTGKPTFNSNSISTNLYYNFIANSGNYLENCTALSGSTTLYGVCYANPLASSSNVFLRGTVAGTSGGPAVLADPNHMDKVAVDGSGNVWVTNQTNVLEFVGGSAPLLTPTVAGVINNKIASRP